MGEAALTGQDKATIRVPDAFAEFGLWVEQLVAESLGKQGKGVVPVPTTEPEKGDDRHHMTVDTGLAATISAARSCGGSSPPPPPATPSTVDPFDEPNVAESKANTKRVLDELAAARRSSAADPDAVTAWLLAQVRPGDYVSLQAYTPYGDAFGLEQTRRRVRDALGGMAVTAGYGPRFLHSTGQLHKGGPNRVGGGADRAALATRRRWPFPGFAYDFGTLIDAQAIGDHQSLVQHGRRVLRVAADDFAEIN